MHLWFLLLTALVTTTTLAHSGRTDANGGHYNRKTGEYHCHSPHCVELGSKGATLYSRGELPRYSRKNWPHWVDEDGDCQNTRAEILIRDSVEPVKFKRNKGCSVSHGKWIGPYTGQVFTKASDVDIDHLVPLAHAYRTGGANWNRGMKRRFANDPGNLLAVDDATNQAKGSRSPAEWKPPLESYWCMYGRKWRHVKRKYALSIDEAERMALREMESRCGYSFGNSETLFQLSG